MTHYNMTGNAGTRHRVSTFVSALFFTGSVFAAALFAAENQVATNAWPQTTATAAALPTNAAAVSSTPPVDPAPISKSEPASVVSDPVAMPSAVTAPAVSSGPVLDELKKLKDADNFSEARAKGLEALKTAANADEKKAIEDLLGKIAAPLVFSKRPMPEKTDYTVANGDSLDRLARKFGTTVDVIRKGNNIQGQVIRIGTRLRIFTGKFSITVSKSQNTLTLTMNDDQFFKRYRVGTGQYSTTPTGTFKITGKVAQPTWYRPDGKSIPYGDKENLLGTHWMSIDVPGFGIHGTWEPDSVGKQSSQGCIRLLNSDIEELFTLVPEGTPVIIQD